MDAGDRATQEQLPRAAKDKREREHVYEISGLRVRIIIDLEYVMESLNADVMTE